MIPDGNRCAYINHADLVQPFVVDESTGRPAAEAVCQQCVSSVAAQTRIEINARATLGGALMYPCQASCGEKVRGLDRGCSRLKLTRMAQGVMSIRTGRVLVTGSFAVWLSTACSERRYLKPGPGRNPAGAAPFVRVSALQRGPALMAAQWIYGSDPSQVFATIVEGRPNGAPSFRGKLTNAHIWELVAYVGFLSGIGRRDVRGGRGDEMEGKSSEQNTQHKQITNSGVPPASEMP